MKLEDEITEEHKKFLKDLLEVVFNSCEGFVEYVGDCKTYENLRAYCVSRGESIACHLDVEVDEMRDQIETMEEEIKTLEREAEDVKAPNNNLFEAMKVEVFQRCAKYLTLPELERRLKL